MVHGKSPDWALAMSKDHSDVVRTGVVGGAAGVAMCASSMGITLAAKGTRGAWVVMGSFDGPVAGGDGRGRITGTELMGICSSSSSEEIGSRWPGFPCLDCFCINMAFKGVHIFSK